MLSGASGRRLCCSAPLLIKVCWITVYLTCYQLHAVSPDFNPFLNTFYLLMDFFAGGGVEQVALLWDGNKQEDEQQLELVGVVAAARADDLCCCSQIRYAFIDSPHSSAAFFLPHSPAAAVFTRFLIIKLSFVFMCVRDALECRFLLYGSRRPFYYYYYDVVVVVYSSWSVEGARWGWREALDRLMNNGAVSSDSLFAWLSSCRVLSSLLFLLLVVVLHFVTIHNAVGWVGRAGGWSVGWLSENYWFADACSISRSETRLRVRSSSPDEGGGSTRGRRGRRRRIDPSSNWKGGRL